MYYEMLHSRDFGIVHDNGITKLSQLMDADKLLVGGVALYGMNVHDAVESMGIMQQFVLYGHTVVLSASMVGRDLYLTFGGNNGRVVETIVEL